MSETISNQINIYVESGDAQKQLDALKQKNGALLTQVEALRAKQAQADTDRKNGNAAAEASYKALGEQISAAQKKLEENTAAMTRQAQKVSGELSPSIRDLEAAVKRLTAAQRAGSETDPGYKDRAKQLEEYRAALDHAKNSAGLLSQKLKEGHKENEGFGASIKEIFTGALEFEAIKESLEKIWEFGKEAIEKYEKLELASKQLNSSLIEQGEVGDKAFKKLIEQAEKLEKTSIFSKEETIGADKKLAVFGLAAEQIEILMPKIQDLASNKMISLEEATDSVVKGLAGTGKGLKTLGIDTSVVAGQLQNNFDKISTGLEKLSGQSDVLAESGIGKSKILANRINADMVSIGKRLLVLKEMSTDFANAFLDNIGPLKTALSEAANLVGGIFEKFRELSIVLGIVTDKGSAAAIIVRALTAVFNVATLPIRAVLYVFSQMVTAVQHGIGAIFGLRAAFSSLMKYFTETAEGVLGGIGKAIKGVFSLNLSDIKSGLNSAKSTFAKGGEELANAFTEGYNKTMEKFKAAGESEPEKEKAVVRSNTGNKQVDGESDTKLKDRLEAYRKYRRDLQNLEDEAKNQFLDANKKEIADLEAKYNKEYQKAEEEYKKNKELGIGSLEDFEKDKAQIRAAFQRSKEELEQKQNKQRMAEQYDTEIKATEETFEKARSIQKEHLAAGLINDREYSNSIVALNISEAETKSDIAYKYHDTVKKAIEDQVKFETHANQQIADNNLNMRKQMLADMDYIRGKRKQILSLEKDEYKNDTDAQLQILAEEYAREYEEHKDNAAAIVALNEATAARIAKIHEDQWRKTLKLVSADIQQIASTAMSIGNSIAKAQDNHMNAEIAADKKKNAALIASYDHQLKSKKISQDKHDKLVQAANEELAKKDDDLKRRQFERDKKMKMAQTAINMALGIVNALATAPNFIVGAVEAALVLAAGIASEVEISSEQYTSMADGGYVEGAAHSDSSGGNPVYDGQTGRLIHKIERGEYVMPKDAAANNPEVIRMLTTVGRSRNIKDTIAPAASVNSQRAMDTIQQANNGFAGTSRSSAAGGSTGGGDLNTNRMESLLQKSNEIHTENLQIQKQIASKPVLSLHHIHEAERVQQLQISQQL